MIGIADFIGSAGGRSFLYWEYDYVTIQDKPGYGIEINPDVAPAHLAHGETWWELWSTDSLAMPALIAAAIGT
jgi:hypothetical protein